MSWILAVESAGDCTIYTRVLEICRLLHIFQSSLSVSSYKYMCIASMFFGFISETSGGNAASTDLDCSEYVLVE
jgi:hypothetical protein